MDDEYKRQQALGVGRTGVGTAAGGYETVRDRGAKQRAEAKQRAAESGGGGAFLAIILVAAAGIVIAFVVTAAMAAVVTSLLLMVAARIGSGSESIGYREAYRASFFVVLTGLLVYAGIGLLAIGVVNGQSGFFYELMRDIAHSFAVGTREFLALFVGPGALANDRGYRSPDDVSAAAALAAWATLLVPAMLCSALALRVTLQGPFSGAAGYLRACLTAPLVIVPGLLAAIAGWLSLAWCGAALFANAQVAQIGEARALAVYLIAAAVIVVYASIGAIVVAVVNHSMSALLQRGASGSFGRSYGTAMFALLVYGLCAAAALYLYRGGDPLVAWLAGVAGNAEPLRHAAGTWPSLWSAMRSFLPLQLPGLVLAVLIVALRTRAPGRGVSAPASASVATALLAIVLALPAMGGGLLVAKTRAVSGFFR